jgi:hypothetical protein
MMTAPSTARPLPLRPEIAVPVRSPRTSIILAELARQRRDERRQRRLKRQQRRHAWARMTAWLTALGQGHFGSLHTQATPGLLFVETTPLVYTLQPL